MSVTTKQVTLILPTTDASCARAARECVGWLQENLDGFSVLDAARTDPAEPRDELVGDGLVRGWFREKPEPSASAAAGPAKTYRDRSVLLFTDVDEVDEAKIERALRLFIPLFFETYSAFRRPQVSLYMAVQGARRVEFRGPDATVAWRLALET